MFARFCTSFFSRTAIICKLSTVFFKNNHFHLTEIVEGATLAPIPLEAGRLVLRHNPL
jgi:hypothetical protein